MFSVIASYHPPHSDVKASQKEQEKRDGVISCFSNCFFLLFAAQYFSREDVGRLMLTHRSFVKISLTTDFWERIRTNLCGPNDDFLVVFRKKNLDSFIKNLALWRLHNFGCQRREPRITHQDSTQPSCSIRLKSGEIVQGFVSGRLTLNAGDSLRMTDLIGHSKMIISITEMPNKCFASASSDHTARLWSSETGLEQMVLSGHTGPVVSVESLPGGLIATGSSDETVRVYHSSGGLKFEIPLMHGLMSIVSGVGSDASVLPGFTFATVSSISPVRFWSENGNYKGNLSNRSNSATSLLKTSEGDFAVSCSNEVCVWSAAGVKSTTLPVDCKKQVRCLLQLESGHFVTGYGDGSLTVWAEKGLPLSDVPGSKQKMIKMNALVNGSIATICENDDVYLSSPHIRPLLKRHKYEKVLRQIADAPVVESRLEPVWKWLFG